jgi:hypothetical protein
MPKYNFCTIFIVSVSSFIFGCGNDAKNTNTLSNTDSVKRIILSINSEQQKLFRTLSTKEERAKKYKEFCHDSLLTIAGYGGLLTNSLDASNDLVDGYADTIHDITLRVYDQTAILTGKAKMFDLINKDTLYEDIWISKVFMNFNGQWKMVLRNSGPLGINYRKPKSISKETLLKYEGNYGLPGDPIDTFRVENNQLYQFGLNDLKIAYYALNDSSFFTKDALDLIVFRTNSNGKVTHFDWTLPDGQIIKILKR